MMLMGKALRRALATADAVRITGDVPLIVDTTELVTPDKAQDMLHRNKHNRPINWKTVEEYAVKMAKNEWPLHAQGIILDGDGNILTGQKRLWAVVYSGVSVHMRISRGTPASAARLLDRGAPQTARDLATRNTERKHSPLEASLARGLLVLQGTLQPSRDQLADMIVANADRSTLVLAETKGTKKSKAVLMILAALCAPAVLPKHIHILAGQTEILADRLEASLQPQGAARCWGRGAAFGLAMENARKIISEIRM
jgi:hypothetical protein